MVVCVYGLPRRRIRDKNLWPASLVYTYVLHETYMGGQRSADLNKIGDHLIDRRQLSP